VRGTAEGEVRFITGGLAAGHRSKICTVSELAALARAHRDQGQRVVLAHGTFDLVHVGHIRHLAAARREGDVLFVTVTADPFVNKGPDRPLFPQQLRVEMLAALGFVEKVAISEAPTSVAVIEAVQPDVYVKGADYKNANDDITGNILHEYDAVQRFGCRIVFTDDIAFSSSELINRHFDVFSPELSGYLARFRQNGAVDRLTRLLDVIKDYRVLLVGETIIDQYAHVHALGKPPKEDVIATSFESVESFAGGVIAAANHVASFCREVEVLTCLGADESYSDLIREQIKPNVRVTEYIRPVGPTTRKLRYVEAAYMRKLFEVYHMDDRPLPDDAEDFLCDYLAKHGGDFDVVIVTDFGHGMISPRLVGQLAANAPFLAVNAQTNSGNAGYNLITKYPRADYVCLDGPEARLAVSDRYTPIEKVAGELLPERIDCRHIIVTTGREGCVAYERGNGAVSIPAFTRTVVDTMGAGDAFLAITSPLVKAGGAIEDIAFIGNAVGALKVGIVGHRQAIEKPSLVKYLTTLLK
jgi:rfaE bifunctional protein nucleotidyltransferase chain/domain